MKKLFTVLAVLLVASLAFAGFSGSVKAEYAFDFDVRTIGYTEPGFGKVDASFKWDSQTYTVGEADGTHIEVALSAGIDGFYGLSEDHADGYDPFKPGYIWAYNVFKAGNEKIAAAVTLSVDTFKIVGKNWEVSFIDDLALDFAKSAIDSKKFNKYTLEYNVANYSMDNSLKGNHNLLVTVYDYKFGFGLGTQQYDADGVEIVGYNDWTDAVTFALTGVTPEYDFSGVKAQFGAGYQVADKTYAFAASAKASYATDKVAVSGAYDAKITENNAKENFVWNDLAVKVDVAPVTVDVYFANDNSVAKDKFKDYFWFAGDDGIPSYVGKTHNKDDGSKIAITDTLASNYLSAKVAVDVAKVAENVPVTVTLTGKNLINEDSQVVSVEAATTIVPNFKFGVYFNDWFANDPNVDATLGGTVEFTGVQNLTLNGEVAYRFAESDRDYDKKLFLLAGASYAHELFTASASVAAEKEYEQDMLFGARAAVVSTSLVKGAELSAKAYFNLNDLEILDDSSNSTNKLVLGCKVSF